MTFYFFIPLFVNDLVREREREGERERERNERERMGENYSEREYIDEW